MYVYGSATLQHVTTKKLYKNISIKISITEPKQTWKGYDKVNSWLRKHSLFLYFWGGLIEEPLLFELWLPYQLK